MDSSSPAALRRIADQLHKNPKRLKTRLMDAIQGAVLGPGGRLVFVIIMMFVGYKLVIVCSKSAYLQDYMASLQPDSVGISTTHKLHNVDPNPQRSIPATAVIDQELADTGRHSPVLRKVDTWPLLYPTYRNETDVFLRQAIENYTIPCYQHATFTSEVFGLPKPTAAGKPIRLLAGKIHDLLIVSYEASGRRRCAGGDFFETDLTGVNWKSRPPVLDNHDGSYGMQVMVDPRFAGLFVLQVVLLFANLHAMDEKNCTNWARLEPIMTVEIEFVVPPHPGFMPDQAGDQMVLPDLRKCTEEDFSLKAWSGRWSRHKWNPDCEIRDDGRFVCIDPNEQCQSPWCEGPVGHLDSNGWVYSAHCKFKIYTQDEAWECLKGRWLFFWGDSNHDDSVRNLLHLVLGLPVEEVRTMRRWFNGTFHHPNKADYSLRVTKIFNGHAEELGNLEGLNSLQDRHYRELLTSFFNGSTAPDTMVMNSGLHDAHFYKNASDFAALGVEYATNFWLNLWRSSNPGGAVPSIVYRTTVTGAGYAREQFGHARDGVPNPHKMEIYNRIFVERLQQLQLPKFKVVDAFDLTFPWHYDLNCSDGVHYGREPSKTLWKDVQIGHQYFVDLMLVHILLNAVCPAS